jgi:hypothetical protein
MREPPPLPRDFLEEVEAALRETATQLSGGGQRLVALEELALVCRRLGRELGRPVSVFDVLRSAGSDAERRRRHALVAMLREPL